jgi:hypothetical protein
LGEKLSDFSVDEKLRAMSPRENRRPRRNIVYARVVRAVVVVTASVAV